MQWQKLGILYVPDGHQSWASSHAMIPTPFRLSEDVLRIYLGHLDRKSVGRIGYVDVAIAEPLRPLAVADKPVLDIGGPGTFDDNGAVPSCVVPVDGGLRLYYSGFQLHTKIPYTIFSGLAASEHADGPFRRSHKAPILDRIDGELFFRASPLVQRDGARWRMWYFGGSDWVQTQRKPLPCYSLRHIESDDGVHWSGRSTECLVPRAPEEIGFGRPFVLRDGAMYRMWYSIRSREGYRLGYATSHDGLEWARADDSVGIWPSETGWDSEMICYAAIVPTATDWLMFYNGNNYGRTGVGVAIARR